MTGGKPLPETAADFRSHAIRAHEHAAPRRDTGHPNRIGVNLSIIWRVLIADGADLNQDENPEELTSQVETVLLAVWRRVVKEGGGPDLTLPEAAVLLGTSVESVRRRIKAGKIDAFYDERGRVRVRAAPPIMEEPAAPDIAIVRAQLSAAEQELAAASSEAHALRQELGLAHFHRREAQQDLEAIQNESQELRDELDTARRALEHTQEELTSMWRVMSARKERAGRQFGGMTDGNEAFDLAQSRDRFEGERARIQDQIARVRSLSKRRRWPWPQAS